MGWFKVDDQLPFHAKTVMAGNAAMGLWVRCGAWSSAHLTDGFIPAHMANAMANDGFANGKDDLPSLLLQSGLWDSADGGYQFHDWSLFQPDAKTEKKRRDDVSRSRSEAGKKGAEARWAAAQAEKPDGKRDGKTMANASGDHGKPMAPTRPVPSLKESATRKPPRKPEHSLPEDFKPNPSHEAKAKELSVDLSWELQKFENHHRARDTRFRNWDQALHGWIKRAAEYAKKDNASAPSSSYIWD